MGKAQKRDHAKELAQIEEQIMNIYSQYPSSIFSKVTKNHLIEMEARKVCLLRVQAETWRLKIHAIRINHGDCNSKKFHKFSCQRKNLNSIWELKDSEGKNICS